MRRVHVGRLTTSNVLQRVRFPHELHPTTVAILLHDFRELGSSRAAEDYRLLSDATQSRDGCTEEEATSTDRRSAPITGRKGKVPRAQGINGTDDHRHARYAPAPAPTTGGKEVEL